MKRRDFLRLAGRTTLIPFLGVTADVSASDKIDIHALFESDREDVLKLTDDVIRKCVLAKIVPPEPPFKQMWVRPGGPYYLGQWIWDTMFVVDLLSLLPGRNKLIRDIFQNYWDFQDRWNAQKPDYARDMITVAIKTEPQEVRQFSQIPILAWGVERVYRRNGDQALLKQCLGRLERFHEWFWRERDVTNVGLVAVGSYSGEIQHARWETFDYECNMDELKLTPHPTRKGETEGAWYGDICVTGNTSYLVLAEKSLMRLAEIMGDLEMAARRKLRIDKTVAAMRTFMWDEKAGTFLSVKRDTMEKIPVATISSWQTPLPVPTVDSTDKRWKSDSFWRGDVWPPTNYQIASGLAGYGHKELAADIADKTVANAIENGISEHYDSISGKALGVKDYCMSSTLVTMMLDGLTRKYTLKLK